jgi:predicted nucleotidyltransferase component of viral defense system
MPKYDKRTLSMQAQELGFIRDTFEKVSRLSSVLGFIQRDPFLSQSLALKGGTAINLTIFNLPRLSVDIDLDYSKRDSRDEMMAQRSDITDIIKRYMAAEGYEFSTKSSVYHSLDSFHFVYMNSAGIRDNVKIELNYSLRCHVLPLEHRSIVTQGFLSEADVLSVAPIEIFASKIVALLSRAAARDLYDINNMLCFRLFDETQEDLLRKCVVFYSAIGSETVPETFDVDRIDSLTTYKIRTDLIPVIRKTEIFDLVGAQERVKSYLVKLLTPTESERSFLAAFRNKKYHPELLFNGEMLERVKDHPMAMWKCRDR